MTTPNAEVDVTEPLVRRLLEDQHPDLAHLPLVAADVGWDNATFRLGESLAVRLPRRAVAAALIEHEQRWLPRLAPNLPLPVPVPIRTGAAASGFPWRWSVLPWLPGEPADVARLDDREAARLAAFLRALHVEAPPDAPVNAVRGVPLHERNDVVRPRLDRLRRTSATFVTETVNTSWEAALSAPAAADACWLHGDLHARNVLVADGALAAVIDWGDLCAGDTATDLAAVWMLIDGREARERAIVEYGEKPRRTWLRALGWAVSFGSVLLETGLADNPRHAAMGADILRRIEEGPNAGDFL